MDNQTSLVDAILGSGPVVGSSREGQDEREQRLLRHEQMQQTRRRYYAAGASAGDTALTSEVPEWLNYVELCMSTCSFVFVVITSCIVLVVIGCTPTLHRIPGMVMAILSVIDILLALFDSGNIIIRLTDELLKLQINYYPVFCQVCFLSHFSFTSSFEPDLIMLLTNWTFSNIYPQFK